MLKLARERLEIFRYRPYTLYFIGTTVSLIGTGMQFIANSWLALELTDANYSVALLLGISSIPGILFSPVLGVFVDRIDRKLLAATMDLFRGVILLSVPLLWWFKYLQPWHLYLMAFLVALGDIVYSPSAKALIVEVIPQKMLLTANSTTSVANQIGSLVGAGSAGLIIAMFSPIAVMVINAGTFFFSAFCILGMPKMRIVPMDVVSKAKGWRFFFAEMKEGIEYVRQHSDIIFKYLMLLFLLTTLRTINVMLAPFAKNVLQVGVKGLGYIDAAFAVGAIFGSFILPVLSRLYGTNRIMINGVWALSASLLFFATSRSLWMGILGYFLIGVSFQVWVLYLTKAQESTDISHQGRVYSFFSTFISIASLGVYAVMGLLVEVISQRWLYVFQGALVAATGLLACRMISYEKKEKDYYD